MKKFNTSLMGYSKEEVNIFIKEVTNNYEALLNKLKEKSNELEATKTALEKYKDLESTFNRAILASEKASSEIRQVARSEAKSIIDEAKRNGSRILNDALIKAEQAEKDADELQRRVDAYKRKVIDIIEEQKEMINDIGRIKF